MKPLWQSDKRDVCHQTWWRLGFGFRGEDDFRLGSVRVLDLGAVRVLDWIRGERRETAGGEAGDEEREGLNEAGEGCQGERVCDGEGREW